MQKDSVSCGVHLIGFVRDFILGEELGALSECALQGKHAASKLRLEIAEALHARAGEVEGE